MTPQVIIPALLSIPLSPVWLKRFELTYQRSIYTDAAILEKPCKSPHRDRDAQEAPAIPIPNSQSSHQEMTNMWVNQPSKDSSPHLQASLADAKEAKQALAAPAQALPKLQNKSYFKPLNFGLSSATRTLYFLSYYYLNILLYAAKSISTWHLAVKKIKKLLKWSFKIIRCADYPFYSSLSLAMGIKLTIVLMSKFSIEVDANFVIRFYLQ